MALHLWYIKFSCKLFLIILNDYLFLNVQCVLIVFLQLCNNIVLIVIKTIIIHNLKEKLMQMLLEVRKKNSK